MGLDVGALLVIALVVYGVKAVADGLVTVVEILEGFRARRRHRARLELELRLAG